MTQTVLFIKEKLWLFDKARYVEKRNMGSGKYILKVEQQFCLWPIFYQMDFMEGNIVNVVLVTVDKKYFLFLNY